jgi:hypothetical protein
MKYYVLSLQDIRQYRGGCRLYVSDPKNSAVQTEHDK